MSVANNSFYLDAQGTGKAFGQYTGHELVDFTRQAFGLSCNREHTFIGGLSMGGFGALRNALKYHQTFGKVFALLSALIVHGIIDMKEGTQNKIADYDYYRSTFRDLSKLTDSENNPEYLVKNLLKINTEIPKIYMTCGTDDFLIHENRRFKLFLDDQG